MKKFLITLFFQFTLLSLLQNVRGITERVYMSNTGDSRKIPNFIYQQQVTLKTIKRVIECNKQVTGIYRKGDTKNKYYALSEKKAQLYCDVTDGNFSCLRNVYHVLKNSKKFKSEREIINKAEGLCVSGQIAKYTNPHVGGGTLICIKRAKYIFGKIRDTRYVEKSIDFCKGNQLLKKSECLIAVFQTLKNSNYQTNKAIKEARSKCQ